jgi:hypothetical protein
MSQPRIRLYPPHFDAVISETAAEAVASCPARVARHAFMPFLQRNEHWTKFSEKNTKPKDVEDKTREIRYACRLDSYIFGYYRNLLEPHYEQELQRLNLGACVTAYRRIPVRDGKSGKCNIHFAKEAFDQIRTLGDCVAFALDIEKFFEHLDHNHLKRVWSRLLGQPKLKNQNHLLPEDHFSVFHAVTSYSCVMMADAYKTLGYIGKVTLPGGKTGIGYLVKREDFPKQICSGKQLREKLIPQIKQNSNPFGIPQGSPISDLLANIYLLDFDFEAHRLISSMGGMYRRYSDDILIILPSAGLDVSGVHSKVVQALTAKAPGLKLKAKKTQIYGYTRLGPAQDCRKLSKSTAPEGLEYLGFRFDGKKVFLRNSTVSGIKRKITLTAKGMARRHLETKQGMPLNQVISSFNYSLLIEKFGRVKDFDSDSRKYTKWTFWTYVKKSVRIFGTQGASISRQMSGYKQFARGQAEKLLTKLYK